MVDEIIRADGRLTMYNIASTIGYSHDLTHNIMHEGFK